ncbi:MAG: DinB family protein [Armatimonadota bacterium]
MNNPYLFKGLAAGPTVVRRIVSQVPPSKYDSVSDPDRFTLREAVAHVADWDSIDLDRIKQIIEDPGCTITPFDETERSIEQNYTSTEVMDQLDLYTSRRTTLIAFLESLAPEAWNVQGFHPEKGILTVYDMANLVLAHDTYHIEHFTQFL